MRIQRQLSLEIRARVELRTRLESARIRNMPVRVDESRHDRAPTHVNPFRVGPYRSRLRHRRHLRDAVAVHDDDGVLDRLAAAAVDEPCANENTIRRRRLRNHYNGCEYRKKGHANNAHGPRC
jgi:hypothetical protein